MSLFTSYYSHNPPVKCSFVVSSFNDQLSPLFYFHQQWQIRAYECVCSPLITFVVLALISCDPFLCLILKRGTHMNQNVVPLALALFFLLLFTVFRIRGWSVLKIQQENMKEVNYLRGAERGKVGWKLNKACEPSNLPKVGFYFQLSEIQTRLSHTEDNLFVNKWKCIQFL